MAVPIGEVDRLVAVIGERGVGKSQWLIKDTFAFRREARGGYVLITTPSARLPDVLHDGTDSMLTWHDNVRSLESWSSGLSRFPERTHVVVGGAPEDTIEYARNLSRSIRRKAIESAMGIGYRYRENRPIPVDRKTGKPIAAEPVYVGIDEGTALRQMAKHSDQLKGWQEFVTGLRHENIALTWSIQSPNARAYLLIEQASQIVAFRYGHEWGLNSLRARGIPQEDLERIRALPKYKFRRYIFNR